VSAGRAPPRRPGPPRRGRSSLAALRERAAAAENECRRLEGDPPELAQRIAATRARGPRATSRRAELASEVAEVERLLAERCSSATA
jgi:hypothetical protein